MKNFERCGHVGDSFELLIAFLGAGPSLPAEQTTTIFLVTAWNAPMETPSVKKASI